MPQLESATRRSTRTSSTRVAAHCPQTVRAVQSWRIKCAVGRRFALQGIQASWYADCYPSAEVCKNPCCFVSGNRVRGLHRPGWSGYIGQFVTGTNVKYDMFGYMPNSCSKCQCGRAAADDRLSRFHRDLAILLAIRRASVGSLLAGVVIRPPRLRSSGPSMKPQLGE